MTFSEVYLPMTRERRLNYGHYVFVSRALFTNYLFCRIDETGIWHPVNRTPGVLGILMDHVGPARVTDSIIAGIRASERDGMVELPEPPDWEIGTPVKIIHGAFLGQLGLYDGMRAAERCAVLLNLFGAERRVDVARSDIEPVQDERHSAHKLNGHANGKRRRP
jgi:transcription antitermination factor NusG